jgi:hypothetical protein
VPPASRPPPSDNGPKVFTSRLQVISISLGGHTELEGQLKSSYVYLIVAVLLALYAALSVWVSRLGRGPGVWWIFVGASFVAILAVVLLELATRGSASGPWRLAEILALVLSTALLVVVPLLVCSTIVQVGAARGLAPGPQWAVALIGAILAAPVALFASLTLATMITGSAL